MPFGEKVQCVKCSKDESLMWHQTAKGVKCNDCFEVEHFPIKPAGEEDLKLSQVEKPKQPSKRTHKAIRSYKTRQNPNALPKPSIPKGKGRRSVFKKKEPVKLTTASATFRTTNTLYHDGMLWRSGDIVSVRDIDGGIYYAQIKMLMTDPYCEKSASITWLIPTRVDSPFKKEGFDPMTFVVGPDDDLPRRLDVFEFVMHCPSDYFSTKTPYPSGMICPKSVGFIWDRLRSDDK